MKTFIAAAIFFLLVRWPFGSHAVRHQWLEYMADFVLIFGFIFCFFWDIQKHNQQGNQD